MDRISDLPQGILQKILYFLSQKEAVRTSVLSKSWRHVWCSRPNLDFSDATFKGNMQQFLSLVNNTLQLYCDQRLCVDEFHLCMSVGDLDHKSISLLKKWIRILTSMSVKKFCLCNRSKNSTGRFKLPSVAFTAKSLQDLHLEGFVLDQKTIRRIVLFKHLTSLSLRGVSMEDEILKKIFSSCPLIEIIRVQYCLGLRKIEVNNLHNLKEFRISDDVDDREEEICSIQIHTPSIETIFIDECNIWFHKGADFRNLKALILWDVKPSLKHLSSCKFPSLVYLCLLDCDGLKGIELFIDAPNIKYFDYEGDFIPSISFAITFSEWISHICLKYRHSGHVSSWFLKLKTLFKLLSHSEITLTLDESEYHHRHDDGEHIIQEINNPGQDNGCDKPVVVESLKFCCPSSLVSSLLNGALSICRPRNIEDSLGGNDGEMERIECLCKILMQREIGKEDEFSLLWFRDLEEVRMEVQDINNREEWHPITLSELPNYHDNNRNVWDALSMSKSSNYQNHNRKEWHPKFDQQRVYTSTRFALKWKQDGN